MSDYFRHARIVSRSLEWARRTAPVPVGPNLGLSRDGIRFLDPVQAARNPASWIGAFQAALDAGTEVTEEALSCIQQHVDRYRADDFFSRGARPRGAAAAAQAAARALRAAVGDARLRAARAGVFPEFQAISWRVVRDFYHKYTVDEHTLLTIRNLERLDQHRRSRTGSASGRRSPSSPSPELLVLGAAAPRRRQVARRRSRARERADGGGRARPAAADRARRARWCCS